MNAPEAPRHMRLVGWKSLVKNSLRGFASIELPLGLKIHDIPILVSKGKVWAALPSKPVLDRDGRQAEVGGKKQYVPILEWRDRALSDKFSAAVVGLIRAEHPDALDEGGEP